MAQKVIFLSGGARSGKSAHAQQLAQKMGDRVLYLATAQVLDEEMERRVALHRASRPAGWDTLEASDHLTASLQSMLEHYDAILLDCVTLLLGGVFHVLTENATEEEFTVAAEAIIEDLLKAIKIRPEPWVIVSNEVGMGIVPDTLMGRVFRDVQGRANQRLAALADEVYLMVAGIPLKVK